MNYRQSSDAADSEVAVEPVGKLSRTIRNLFVSLFVSLLTGLSLSGCGEMSQEAKDTLAVQACFRRFQAAVIDKDKQAATAELSQNTIEYFENLRQYALTLDAEGLQQLPMPMRIEVLLLRDRVTAEELLPLDGRALAERFLFSGWINDQFIRDVRVGNVICKGDFAEARIAGSEGMRKQRFGFQREGVEWRFNLAGALNHVGTLYDLGMRESGLEEGAFIKELLLNETKRRPLDILWEPLAPSPL